MTLLNNSSSSSSLTTTVVKERDAPTALKKLHAQEMLLCQRLGHATPEQKNNARVEKLLHRTSLAEKQLMFRSVMDTLIARLTQAQLAYDACVTRGSSASGNPSQTTKRTLMHKKKNKKRKRKQAVVVSYEKKKKKKKQM